MVGDFLSVLKTLHRLVSPGASAGESHSLLPLKVMCPFFFSFSIHLKMFFLSVFQKVNHAVLRCVQSALPICGPNQLRGHVLFKI